jgi:integrase
MSVLLSKSKWRSADGKNVIEMDFEEAMIPVEDDPNDPKRMPWTPEHLRVLFALPLWQGAGGALARLKSTARPIVCQDAAYWVPLIGIYTGMAREEVCGLEVIDFIFDCEVPHLLVQANMTRSHDGVTPGGLKRKSRHRVMPIHPELLRLGIREYVERIAAEAGYGGPEQIIPIFPELYLEEAKRKSAKPTDELVAPEAGGSRFYKRAWMGIVDATHCIMPLPETRDGKKADFHSARTYTQSVLASPEVSQTLIDRIMGHAAKGTGPRKYNRRALAVGEMKALKELLDLLVKQMPVVTEHVHRQAAVKLLPLYDRSRVGSAPGRDVSRYFLLNADQIRCGPACKRDPVSGVIGV